MEVGLQVSKKLGADFSLIIARKLPFPDNPEAGFGAIARMGALLFLKMQVTGLPGKLLNILNRNRLLR
ncbi:hypothetical protein [Methanosarcina horonobensis]|uniref:hypothetical protein n=1 Tax=Methanosarcina horonobensis TaxID=418008 RepID=UPI000B225373|nr:hypothetical protein [Methanosarcina horonobensis]